MFAWSGDLLAALKTACRTAGASVWPRLLSEALEQANGGGFIVSIRREDRERFEETVAGVYSRWIGETIAMPELHVS